MPIRTPRDAYRSLKKQCPNAILAFGIGEMLEFIATDAHEMNRLCQLDIQNPNGYDVAVIHSSRYFQLKAKLKLLGREMRLVKRTRTPTGKTVFQVQAKDL